MYSTVTESNLCNEIWIQEVTLDDVCKEPSKPKENSEKNPLQCGICGLIICNKWNFTLHMRIHNNDRRYKCDQCSASFIIPHDLKKHTLAHAGIKPAFKCQFCPKTYTSRHSKYLHEDSHNKLQYKCRHCSEIFSKFLERRNHEKQFHKKDGFNCSICNKKFTSKGFLEAHEKNYHNKEEGGFRCHQCGLLFESSICLSTHRRIHVAKTIVIEKEDSLGYEKKDVIELKKKKPIELYGIRVHECIICTKRYKSRTEMITHMSNSHPKETKAIFKFACDHCGKTFKNKQGLGQHLITHNGEKKYSCSICDYKTKRNTDLKVHMRNHTGESPYMCDQCGRRFKHIKSYQYHKKVHIEKVFKCEHCDKSFYRGRDLERHEKKHKKFQCNKCGKFLANPLTLKNHVESGKCEEFYVANLTKRIKNIEKCSLKFQAIEKNYECFACGFSTCSELDMSNHEASHNIKDVPDKITLQIDTDYNSETKKKIKKTKKNLLPEILESSSEKSEYNGVSLPSSSSDTINLTITELDESLNFSDDIFDTHLCSDALMETLKSNIVVINGKKYLSLDEIKRSNLESLTPCLKNLLKILL